MSGTSRSGGPSDPLQWIIDRFRWLTQQSIIDDLVNIASSSYLELHPWTLVKLVILAEYIANVYTLIIPRYYDGRFIYVDLYAGPGLNVVKYQDRRIHVPGSPVIAYAFAREEFEKMILVDIDSRYLAVAKQRLIKLGAEPGKIVTICGDVNDPRTIESILRHVPKDRHCLIFIDPPGLPPKYSTMQSLLQWVPSDVILLIQRRFMWMKKHHPKGPEILTRIFGDETWKDCTSEDELVHKYLERLASIGPRSVRREIFDYIPIRLYQERIHYDLAFLVRRTGGGSPWFKAILYLKQRVNEINKMIEYAFNVFTGSIHSLLEFLPPNMRAQALVRSVQERKCKSLDIWLKR